MKSLILFITSIFYLTIISCAQDMSYTHKILKKLASDEFFGRGYVNKGDSLAAEFLKQEFKNIGIKSYNDSYFQYYNISINTIIENPELKFGKKELFPTKDFVVIPNSPDFKGWVPICWINKDMLTNYWSFNHFFRSEMNHCFICLDSTVLNNPDLYSFANLIFSKGIINAKGIIEATDRLKYSARTEMSDLIHIQVKPEAIDFNADSIFISISNKFYEEYQTQNIIGIIEGETDSIIMITAHYDHLGMKGDIMFPGANDNASGVSMVLNLAKYFMERQGELKHNLVFVLFSGEEAGLLGSKHFADNPYFDLSLVTALINFDMVGTGEDGLAVFNAKEYPNLAEKIKKINKEKDLFEHLRTSYAVYSSDHAPFHDKGVKAMFFYLFGDNSNYHQPEDVYEDVSFYGFETLFIMIKEFVGKL